MLKPKCGSSGHRVDRDVSGLDTRRDSWSGTETGSASGRQVVGLRYRYGVGGRIVGDRPGQDTKESSCRKRTSHHHGDRRTGIGSRR